MELTLTHRAAVAFVAAALIPTALAAQGRRSTLSVSVTDAKTGLPLPGAEVVLPELRLLERSDSLGRARVEGVPRGTHRVRVRLVGYVASDVPLEFTRDTIDATFKLEPSVAALPDVTVTAAEVPAGLKDFEIRRKQGIGRFLTEADLARDADREFMTVASLRFPGLTMRTDESGQTHLAGTRSGCGAATSTASTTRGVDRIGGKPGLKPELGARDEFSDKTISGSCESTRPCLVQVWLDGINLGETDHGILRTWDLSGVEYFTGNSVPARYRNSGSACGVILLWSKWR